MTTSSGAWPENRSERTFWSTRETTTAIRSFASKSATRSIGAGARRSGTPPGGWTVRTDLGYFARVTASRLVTRNLELIPCHAMSARSLVAALLRWLRRATVYADHSSLVPNESKISTSHEEDLAAPAGIFLEG